MRCLVVCIQSRWVVTRAIDWLLRLSESSNTTILRSLLELPLPSSFLPLQHMRSMTGIQLAVANLYFSEVNKHGIQPSPSFEQLELPITILKTRRYSLEISPITR